jgi:hypothetical protein
VSYRRLANQAVRKALWQASLRHNGEGSPVTRAKFGRYVGSRGGVLSAVGSGEAAWVANYRQRGLDGFHNRGYRRAVRRAVTNQGRAPMGLLLFTTRGYVPEGSLFPKSPS